MKTKRYRFAIFFDCKKNFHNWSESYKEGELCCLICGEKKKNDDEKHIGKPIF